MSEGPAPGTGDWRLGIGPRPPRGEQGEHGDQGERGATGAAGAKGIPGVIPPRIRRAFASLFVLMFALAAVNLFWSWHLATASQAAQRAGQTAAQRQSAMVERKICTTMSRLAALRPPAGNPATNPSRAYLQGEHDTLVQLGTDLGCRT